MATKVESFLRHFISFTSVGGYADSPLEVWWWLIGDIIRKLYFESVSLTSHLVEVDHKATRFDANFFLSVAVVEKKSGYGSEFFTVVDLMLACWLDGPW